jgi:hypothetical protein
MPAKVEHELPDGASALLGLIRAAHREGNRELERAGVEKLSRDYGMTVSFPCCESVDRELAAGLGREGRRDE